ncbi:putative methylaconitate Delta-isomerase PrpF, partial [Xylella fastidiosa subsp. multiplex]|nr:putative methylaconitate Delta-isomerase PrpF [Xylella fastidiosa subsp. multiplex]
MGNVFPSFPYRFRGLVMLPLSQCRIPATYVRGGSRNGVFFGFGD